MAIAGANFRERERIKRKAQRWAAKLAAMPKPERDSILSLLAETVERPAAVKVLRPLRGFMPLRPLAPLSYVARAVCLMRKK